MNNEVKMVVCDLDGTLLYNTKTITERSKKAIRELREQGILFGICSGRPAGALRHLLEYWGIENDVDFVLGFNGGQYFEPGSEPVVCGKMVDGSVMKDLEKSFGSKNIAFAEYSDKAIETTKKNFLTQAMANRNRIGLEEVKPVQLQKPSLKMMAVGMPWTISSYLKSDEPKKLSGKCRMFQSGPFLIEIVHPELNKLEGVRYAANKHGISLDEVVTFGNDNNDAEMLEGTIGVAMKNALPSIKEKASFVTDSNLNDGVAKFIEKEILSR